MSDDDAPVGGWPKRWPWVPHQREVRDRWLSNGINAALFPAALVAVYLLVGWEACAAAAVVALIVYAGCHFDYARRLATFNRERHRREEELHARTEARVEAREIAKPARGQVVVHLDGNRFNNHPDNLRVQDREENRHV